MIIIGNAQARSTAAPAGFFRKWGDMATWPEWNKDTEWVRLDGPFETGSRGVLKPKGGPKVKFVIESLIPDREFVDVSQLVGARLTFSHSVETLDEGGCRVDVTVTMTGPLRWLWFKILGSGLQESLQPDLDRLVAAVEAAR